MEKNDTSFPLEIKSPLINYLQVIIIWSIKLLACLMCLMIVWSVLDVIAEVYQYAKQPNFFRISVDEILTLFGSFLVVLIAIEIFINIVLYLKKGSGHVKLVIATALMAIARKIIVLDYQNIDSFYLSGVGIVIIALGITYWLVSRANESPTATKT